jgi:DNA invertase Pin-like site-specific DNA recombinase
MAEKFVSLVRVSTSRQGDSGLGLLAQKEQVEQHIRAVGGELVQEFVEVESGRKIQRPMLEEAIALAKAYNATLIIAKWDSSRDAHYLLGLQKSGVKLVVADNPNAAELTIGILAVIAEDEVKRISDRVTRALAAAKARGQVLGAYDKKDKNRFIGRTGTKEDCITAATAKKQYAKAKAENYKPLLDRLNPDG